MEKTNIDIKGMHCSSCEILVEDELLEVPGVKSATVNYREGKALVCHEGRLNHEGVSRAIQKAGYSIGKDVKPFFSKNAEDYKAFGIVALIAFIAWYAISNLNIFSFIPSISNNYSSLPIVLLVGLTAGISTCMALVGGLVLGASAKFAEMYPKASSFQKFTPHIFFNIGRIATFFVLGGVVGLAGSVFQLSTSVLGILTIAIGIVMLSVGIQLIDLFPKLSAMKLTMPKIIGKTLGIKSSSEKEYSHTNSMILGGLTFFLPCGFTQAMQLFAMSSGNFWTGSLTMGVFAIGTAPGLLGIGGLTSVVKGAFANYFFKFAGIVVILLALFNISNGFNLTGFGLPNLFASASASPSVASDPNVTLENGVQIVKMDQTGSGYTPNTFTIKKGVPVKWVINSIDPNTCAGTIVSQSINVRKTLSLGENIIEFTPSKVGQIKFSCAMGMYTGVFNVTDGSTQGSASGTQNQPQPQVAAAQAAPSKGGSCGAGGGGGCGCGGGAKKAQAPQGPAVAAVKQADAQVINTTFTLNNDIQPNNFTVKAGVPVKMVINVKENGQGCMGTIMIPGLVNEPKLLTQGEDITFNFTPQKTGSFPITCAMGIPRGAIQVN